MDGVRLPSTQKWARILAIVNRQAEDFGVWFDAETASEAYLQDELRRLHAAIEDDEDEE